MKKIVLAALFLTILFLLLVVKPTGADYGQYGEPSPTQTILVDKLVGKPDSPTKGGLVQYQYVDNLSPSDPKFAPGQEVLFQVKIKNISNAQLTNVEVKDFVPSYVEAIEGPGSYDAGTGTITFNAGNFDVDQEKIYIIKMKVLAQSQLPVDKGLFCLVNKVRATGGSTADEDTSQFCVEKQVTGAAKVPSAGPEFAGLLLAGNLLGLGLGFKLKKSK